MPLVYLLVGQTIGIFLQLYFTTLKCDLSSAFLTILLRNMPLVVPFICIILSVNKFLNLKKRDRLPRLTSLSALLTVNQRRYAIPLRYAIRAAFGIRIFPFLPCPARTKGISFLAISCLMVNSFNPRISRVHSFMVSISTGCSAEFATGISFKLC